MHYKHPTAHDRKELVNFFIIKRELNQTRAVSESVRGGISEYQQPIQVDSD